MLVKFESEGAAPFEMLSESSSLLVKLMGQSNSNEGSISGAAIPAALASLEAGLARLASETQDSTESDSESDDDDEDEVPPVGLRLRAVPLIEMLHHAASNDSYVMWRQA